MAVNVPHTWNVLPEYANYDGLAWYRKRFMLPSGARAAHIRLRFEAVFYLARVWLNGEYIGQHEGGYTPFEFDVHGFVKPGEENVLAVQVDNRRAINRIPASFAGGIPYDWWNYGGIVRDVSLEISSRVFISRQRVIATPHLTDLDQADRARITATIGLRNTTAGVVHGVLTADLLEDAVGRSALSEALRVAVSLPPDTVTEFSLGTEIASPKLWHFDHPHLYRWQATLRSHTGQILHEAEVNLGIRSVELKEGHLSLNGEPVRLVGLTRHADSPQSGLAETTAIMAADYNDLKVLNEVLSRPVHYPQSEFILDYADRHGILLIPEVPAWGLKEYHLSDPHLRELEKQQLQEMIEAGFNHPSIWAWSVANEIASDTEAGREFVREMIEFVKTIDPTRPVGFASNRIGFQPEKDGTRYSDFVMLNQYFGSWHGSKEHLGPLLDNIHQTWPEKAIIISEFGLEPHWNINGPPAASLDPEKYYFIPETASSESEEADGQRRMLIKEQMAILRSKPFVAGAIFWTYQDYRTPLNFKMGVVDMQRNRRGSWYVLREEFAPALFDTVTFSNPAGGRGRAEIAIVTRGPIEDEMPAYTLRGYRLDWEILATQGGRSLAEGSAPLPVLPPGSRWEGEIGWEIPQGAYRLTLSIVRPTGFPVIERSWDQEMITKPR